MSQPTASPQMPQNESYPTAQGMMISDNTPNNASVDLQKQDESSVYNMLRLRGGGCIKGCLEAICCCCALDAICCCELDEICC